MCGIKIVKAQAINLLISIDRFIMRNTHESPADHLFEASSDEREKCSRKAGCVSRWCEKVVVAAVVKIAVVGE
ncbi:hypothetical protein E2C01_099084 [Portunus trituberculatus]|uniref:Uncharacterized protein n=1 Tax=Portunus trituberculatus TaxID=210409 RepID=A0A5B7KFV9_PORTR|nr:hypothetical protein [Portunus trituberculatus]